MLKPTHYLVVRSPYAEALVTGVKTAEFRSWAHRLAGKCVAIAVAKAKPDPREWRSQCHTWEATPTEFEALRGLTEHNPPLGRIIGAVQFGDAGECDWPHPGELCALVEHAELWDRAKWLDSPGGLGLRPL